MSVNLKTAAAIPPRDIRATRGRLLAELAAGGVGAWDWSPTPVPETVGGATVVKVFNYGDNTIKRWEACSIPDSEQQTEFFDETWACSVANTSGCGHGRYCNLGACGVFPESYEDVYTAALDHEPVVIQVTTASPVIPKPGFLGGWLVAAQDIGVEQYGFAYAAGIHYAMVWDPGEILGNGPELAFVDLPEYDAGYVTGDSSPTINLPLQVRANGRARVIAYDRLVELGSTAPSSDWGMDKVRLALIQRSNHFTSPTIPCVLTAAEETVVDSNRYDYGWRSKGNANLTQANVTTALNLTETNNTASFVNGLTAAQLNDCFGVDGWALQNAYDGQAEVLMSFCLDDNGLVQPYFCLQNQVIPT